MGDIRDAGKIVHTRDDLCGAVSPNPDAHTFVHKKMLPQSTDSFNATTAGVPLTSEMNGIQLPECTSILGSMNSTRLSQSAIGARALIDATMRQVLQEVDPSITFEPASSESIGGSTIEGEVSVQLAGFIDGLLIRLGQPGVREGGAPLNALKAQLFPEVIRAIERRVGTASYEKLTAFQRALLIDRVLRNLSMLSEETNLTSLVKTTLNDGFVKLIGSGLLDFTYEQEVGTGKYESKVPHVPPGGSGVTIGPGLDMRYRTEKEVTQLLLDAGVDRHMARSLAKGVSLTGDAARKFVTHWKADHPGKHISEVQQKKLFLLLIPKYIHGAQRFVDKTYHRGVWDKLSVEQQAMLVDMQYNPGLSIFRKFTKAVVHGNREGAIAQHKRYAGGKELGRNKLFYNAFLSTAWPAAWKVVP